MFEYEGKL